MAFLKEFAKQQIQAKISPKDLGILESKITSTLARINQTQRELKDFKALIDKNEQSCEQMYPCINKVMREALKGIEVAYKGINEMEFLVRAV